MRTKRSLSVTNCRWSPAVGGIPPTVHAVGGSHPQRPLQVEATYSRTAHLQRRLWVGGAVTAVGGIPRAVYDMVSMRKQQRRSCSSSRL